MVSNGQSRPRRLIAVALLVGLLSLISVAAWLWFRARPSAPLSVERAAMGASQQAEAAALLNGLQNLATSEDWRINVTAVTLSNGVVSVWVSGPSTRGQLLDGEAVVTPLLHEARVAGYSQLRFRRFNTGADYGTTPLNLQ